MWMLLFFCCCLKNKAILTIKKRTSFAVSFSLELLLCTEKERFEEVRVLYVIYYTKSPKIPSRRVKEERGRERRRWKNIRIIIFDSDSVNQIHWFVVNNSNNLFIYFENDKNIHITLWFFLVCWSKLDCFTKPDLHSSQRYNLVNLAFRFDLGLCVAMCCIKFSLCWKGRLHMEHLKQALLLCFRRLCRLSPDDFAKSWWHM